MSGDREALRAAVESALGESVRAEGRLEVWAKSGRWTRIRRSAQRSWERSEAHEVGVACRYTRHGGATFAAASGTTPAAGREAARLALAGPLLPPNPLPPPARLGVSEVPQPREGLPDEALEPLARALATRLGARSRSAPELVELRLLQGRGSVLIATSDGFVAAGLTAAAVAEAVFLAADGPARLVHRALPSLAGQDAEELAQALLHPALLPRGGGSPRRQLARVLLSPAVAAVLLTAAAKRPAAERARSRGGGWRLIDARAGEQGLGALPCDGEGLPARTALLAGDGAGVETPCTWLDAQHGRGTPGGATRVSYREPPRSAPANLVFEASAPLCRGDLETALGDGFVAALPLGDLALDPRSGSFSLPVTASHHRGGNATAGYPAARLRGSLARLLAGIEACGGEVASLSLDCAVTTPALLVRGLEIG